MSVFPEDYVEHVLEDIQYNVAGRKIIKAGLIERYTIRAMHPLKMHANPNDEFSQPAIGPNFEIISGYVKAVRQAQIHGLPIFEEPIIVEKLEGDGYLLLNGHHRWFAALRMSVGKVAVRIVNLVHEEDMSRMISSTDNNRRIVFDLHEVLLTEDEKDLEPIRDTLFAKRIKERLRAGAGEVIRRYQAAGYDVWIYTTSYDSEEYINNFFSMYELTVNGIVNGISEKRHSKTDEAERIKKMMAEKYIQALNVDNEGAVLIDSVTKNFEQYSFDNCGQTWSESVIALLDKL